MTDKPLNTWQEIASYLKISVRRCMRMKRKYPDFPVFFLEDAWTTEQALAEWFRKKALAACELYEKQNK